MGGTNRGRPQSRRSELWEHVRRLSLGYLLTPWRSGLLDTTGAVALETGVRILHPAQPVFADSQWVRR
jgi:hypothetical protein